MRTVRQHCLKDCFDGKVPECALTDDVCVLDTKATGSAETLQRPWFRECHMSDEPRRLALRNGEHT